MVKIAKDTPRFLLEAIKKINLNKVTPEMYNNWLSILNSNLGNYAQLRETKPDLVAVPLNIPQYFADVINKYDLGKLSRIKIAAAKPIINNWINRNLPLN